jgi:hypothetical protein
MFKKKTSLSFFILLIPLVLFPAFLSVSFALTPTGLTYIHKNGQTFLTWDDVSGATKYMIYRSKTQLIGSTLTPANLKATIDGGSTYFKSWDLSNWGMSFSAIVGSKNFRITDLGAPLPDSKELFVWTTQDAGGGAFYYVVTAVQGSLEDKTINANQVGPVAETECTMIYPVEFARSSDGTGHIYVTWMPYDKWNTRYEGYAYPFYVAASSPIKKRVQCNVHPATAQFLWMTSTGTGIKTAAEVKATTCHVLYFDSPRYTWHYGFADSVYKDAAGDTVAAAGSTVKNYTEYRYWCAIRWLCSGKAPMLGDSDEVAIEGSSMGGTGANTFSMHHPDIFAYTNIAGVGINNWVTNPSWSWQTFDAKLFGYGQNLKCVDLISKTKLIDNRDVGMSAIGWQSPRDSVLGLIQKNDRDICFYNLGHGTQDVEINWLSQGKPIYSDHANNAFAKNKIPYSAAWFNVGHTGLAQKGMNSSCIVSKKHFVLALKNSTSDDVLASACLTATCNDSGQINTRVLWSKLTDAVNTAKDTPDTFETTIKLDANPMLWLPAYKGPATPTVDITPRRLYRFIHTPGTKYKWYNIPVGGNTSIDTGTVSADAYGLFTINAFKFTATGNKLRVIRQGGISIRPFRGEFKFAGNPISLGRQGTVLRFNSVNGMLPSKVEITDVHGKTMNVTEKEKINEIKWGNKNTGSGIYFIHAMYGKNRMTQKILALE